MSILINNMVDELERPTKRIREEIIESYVKRLGLEWPVELMFTTVINEGMTTQQEVVTPFIFSEIEERKHHLVFPVKYIPTMQESVTEIVELMVRAKLSEDIDPLFSAVKYYEKYPDEIKGMLHYAQRVDDVWAHDSFAVLEPGLFDLNLGEEIGQLAAMGRRKDADAIEAFRGIYWDIILQSALGYADIKRHGKPKYMRLLSSTGKDIERLLGPRAFNLSVGVGNFYKDFPQLPSNKDEALSLYEQKTQVMAKMLGFPIYPILSMKEGEWTWKVEMI